MCFPQGHDVKSHPALPVAPLVASGRRAGRCGASLPGRGEAERERILLLELGEHVAESVPFLELRGAVRRVGEGDFVRPEGGGAYKGGGREGGRVAYTPDR